jgi:hypothetical protein
MTDYDDEPQGTGHPPTGAGSSSHPEQVHPEQEAHGGSMAPGLVDDTGHPIEETPEATGK